MRRGGLVDDDQPFQASLRLRSALVATRPARHWSARPAACAAGYKNVAVAIGLNPTRDFFVAQGRRADETVG